MARPFRVTIFLASRVASTMGDQLLQFAVPLIVFRSTGSISMSGLAFLCEWLPRLISLPLAGVIADRFDGGRVYVCADATRAAACIMAALGLVWWPSHGFVITGLLMALCAFCYAQAFIALETTLPRLVPMEQMAHAQSLLQLINYSSGMFGPSLAGVLLLWIRPTQLILAAATVFAFSAAGAVTLRIVMPAQLDKGPVDIFGDIRAGIVSVLSTPILLRLIVLAMMVNLIVGVAMATGAAMTVGHFAQRDQFFASLQIAIGVLSVGSFLLAPWLLRRLSVYQIGKGAYLLIIAGGMLMAAANAFPVYVLGYGLSLGLCGLFNVFVRTERLHWIETRERGRTIGVIVLLNQLSLPLAGLLVAAVGGRFPVQYLYLVVVAMAAVSYLLLFRQLGTRVRAGRAPQQS